jgi:hypothetical protein
MKKLLIPILLIGCSIISYAQNTALTKEEAVNYLNKKVKEAIGHYITVDFGGTAGKKTLYFWSSSVSLSGDKITFSRERANYKERQYAQKTWVSGHGYQYFYPCDYLTINDQLTFNPAHILKIENYDGDVAGEPVGSAKITLKSNTGIFKRTAGSVTSKFTDPNSDFYGRCVDFKEQSDSQSTNTIYISYLKADDTNFNKIKKALEYLRDLLKAEDDPFGP